MSHQHGGMGQGCRFSGIENNSTKGGRDVMKPTNMINDKQKFQKTASQFFNILFAESLKKNCGEIEFPGLMMALNFDHITIMLRML